jgi:hypothetical protein
MILKPFYIQWEKSFLSLFAAVFLLGAPSALAKDDPKLPTPETDKALIEDIKKGLADSACTQRVTDYLKKYDDKLAEVKKETAKSPAPADSAIRKMEDGLEILRNDYLKEIQKCGPCRTRDLEDWDSTRSGYWYVTDGSCVLDTTKTALLKDAFTRTSTSLKTKGDYLKFGHIVKVAVVGSSQDAFDDKAMLTDEFHAFLAIRTPLEFLGRIQTFFYYIRNTIVEGQDANGKKTFALSFTSYLDDNKNAKRPIQPAKTLVEKFKGKSRGAEEKFFYTTPGGRKLLMDFNELKLVQGQWFISEDGTLRYSTFGDFFVESSAVKNSANLVLLEALLEMYKRALGGDSL